MAVTILPAGTVGTPVVDLGALVAMGLWAAEDLMIDFFETVMGVTSHLNLWFVTALSNACSVPKFGAVGRFLNVPDKEGVESGFQKLPI
jgi:hypothetical protein